MIVIVEGPRCSGKTTFARELFEELKSREISVSIWKASRGEDSVFDMLNSLEGFAEDRVWILDRFHLTEWINSRILQRGWASSSEWREIEGGLINIDNELRKRNTIIILLTAQSYILRKRWKKTKRVGVIINEPQRILRIWETVFDLTRCDIIHLRNNTRQMLTCNVNITADLIKGRIR